MSYPDMFEEALDTEILNQGDIFLRFDWEDFPTLEFEELGFLILTYTCDMHHPGDLTHICFCPIFRLNDLVNQLLSNLKKKNPQKKHTTIINTLKQHIHKISNYVSRFNFFLSPYKLFNDQPAYADLGLIYNIPVKYLSLILSNKVISLKSPWREKLGYKIGYLFNRVATIDIKEEIINDFTENLEIIKRFLDEDTSKK